MRNSLLSAVFCTALLFSGLAHAESKILGIYWGTGHWRNVDFDQPYLEKAKPIHNRQWDAENWKPADWASQRGGDPMNVVNDLFAAGIFTGQDERDGVPVLKVGKTFYRLGGQDKRRAVAMVDAAYGITGSKENGMFFLDDGKTESPVGIYTKYGLQLQ